MFYCVTVKVVGKKNISLLGGEELVISDPSKLPDPSIISEISEPMVLGTIVTPGNYNVSSSLKCNKNEEETHFNCFPSLICLSVIFGRILFLIKLEVNQINLFVQRSTYSRLYLNAWSAEECRKALST